MTSTDTPDAHPSPARRITLMVAGLVLLAGSFAFAVPRRAEIAEAMAPPMTFDVPTEMPDMDPPAPDADISDGPVSSVGPLQAVPDETSASSPAGRNGGSPSPSDEAKAETGNGPETVQTMQVLTKPVAVDTTVFQVGKAKVRLTGIEAPPVEKRCELSGGGTWPCGARARTALRGWLRARSIQCEVPADFAKSQSLTDSSCTLDRKDIGAWLVENGWAEAAPGSRYEEAETKARAARLGLWGNP